MIESWNRVGVSIYSLSRSSTVCRWHRRTSIECICSGKNPEITGSSLRDTGISERYGGSLICDYWSAMSKRSASKTCRKRTWIWSTRRAIPSISWITRESTFSSTCRWVRPWFRDWRPVSTSPRLWEWSRTCGGIINSIYRNRRSTSWKLLIWITKITTDSIITSTRSSERSLSSACCDYTIGTAKSLTIRYGIISSTSSGRNYWTRVLTGSSGMIKSRNCISMAIYRFGGSGTVFDTRKKITWWYYIWWHTYRYLTSIPYTRTKIPVLISRTVLSTKWSKSCWRWSLCRKINITVSHIGYTSWDRSWLFEMISTNTFKSTYACLIRWSFCRSPDIDGSWKYERLSKFRISIYPSRIIWFWETCSFSGFYTCCSVPFRSGLTSESTRRGSFGWSSIHPRLRRHGDSSRGYISGTVRNIWLKRTTINWWTSDRNNIFSEYVYENIFCHCFFVTRNILSIHIYDSFVFFPLSGSDYCSRICIRDVRSKSGKISGTTLDSIKITAIRRINHYLSIRKTTK